MTLVVGLLVLAGLGVTLGMTGCAAALFAGGVAQNFEYQKLLRVPPQYPDLAGQKVAVIVDADYTLLYEYPDLAANVAGGVALRIARHVPDAKVLNPNEVIQWQWATPQWNAMTYGEMAESLHADRVIVIDIYEYRLNPPGNRFIWDGVCAGNVGVVERDAFDPDMFGDSYSVVGAFPDIPGVDRTQATADQIQTGVLAEFIKRTAWLFYEHLEPKYPDKFQPELATPEERELMS
jgi:hypothetical protein